MDDFPCLNYAARDDVSTQNLFFFQVSFVDPKSVITCNDLTFSYLPVFVAVTYICTASKGTAKKDLRKLKIIFNMCMLF